MLDLPISLNVGGKYKRMLNKIQLIGWVISDDPLVKTMPNGAKCVEFRMVTEDRFRNADGEKKKHEDTHIIQAWASKANVLLNFFRKDMLLFVEGKSKFEEWICKRTGQNKKRTIVVVDQFKFLEPVGEGEGEYGEEENG